MRKRLILSLGMCALTVGFAQTRPTPDTPQGEPRVTPRALIAPAPALDPALLRVEPGDKVNKIPEAANSRKLTSQDVGSSAVPALLDVPTRKVSGDDPLSFYTPPSDWRVTPRTLIAPAPALDPALLRVEPGDKVNKIPEAANSRKLTSQDVGSSAVPADLITPAERRVGGR